MQTVVNVSCDGPECQHVRAKDTNHWLVGVVLYNNSITLAFSRAVLVLHMSGTGSSCIPEDVKDFCGEACASKWVSKMFTEIKHD